jgi:hypothetical protein
MPLLASFWFSALVSDCWHSSITVKVSPADPWARLLTRDAARRIAAGIAKLPDMMRWLSIHGSSDVRVVTLASESTQKRRQKTISVFPFDRTTHGWKLLFRPLACFEAPQCPSSVSRRRFTRVRVGPANALARSRVVGLRRPVPAQVRSGRAHLAEFGVTAPSDAKVSRNCCVSLPIRATNGCPTLCVHAWPRWAANCSASRSRS